MERQLFLLAEAPDTATVPADDPGDGAPAGSAIPPSWRLDEHTRAVGREGIARARAALRRAASQPKTGHGDDKSAKRRAA